MNKESIDEMQRDGLKITGAPSLYQLHQEPCYQLPDESYTHPIAVIECIEGIPCNPCETACPHHAISIGEEITNLPKVDMKVCTGCGLCVASCPGLAIYLKQFQVTADQSLIVFPYEYLPLPTLGEEISMVDRYGKKVCSGVVLKILQSKRQNKTVVIYASYPKEYYEDVVSMQRL